MKTAYLVAHIDITKTPAVISGVGVYSDNAMGLTNNWRLNRNADLISYQAETYAEAAEKLRAFVASDVLFAWVRPLMRER